MVVFSTKKKVFRLLNHLSFAIAKHPRFLPGFDLPVVITPRLSPEGKLNARDSNPHPPPGTVALYHLELTSKSLLRNLQVTLKRSGFVIAVTYPGDSHPLYNYGAHCC